jgi:hypothetical protein
VMSDGTVEGTMIGGRSPPMQKLRNWRQQEMDGSGDHLGQQRCGCNGRRQRQWATMAAQWAAGQWSNHDGQ